MHRYRRLVFILLIASAILGALAHYYFGFSHSDRSGHAWGSDDAYISYRYARNLAEGVGLVFNPQARVEGYSNFLYTLLAALFVKLNIESVYFACFVFNVLVYACTVILFYKYNEKTQSTFKTQLATLALCMAPILWLWPASGLETSLVLFVQLSLFIMADIVTREHNLRLFLAYLLLIFLSILLRADGFIFPLLTTFFFLYKARCKLFFSVIAYIVVVTGLIIMLRYFYYGDFMPNTYYAKVSGNLADRIYSAGVQLLTLFHLNSFYIYLLPVLSVFYFIVKVLKERRPLKNDLLVIIPFIILGLLSCWVYIGGDVFFERFLLILLPLSMIYFMRLLSEKWFATAVIFILVLQFKPFVSDSRFFYQKVKYDRWLELGQYLGSQYEGVTIAVEAAGKIPYYSELETIDMLGLNDRHIGKSKATFFRVGHNKYDPDYVLARQPELIAGWSLNSRDLEWGIVKTKYREHGYRLKYMVNTNVFSQSENIIDVSDWEQRDIDKLRDKGFKYFVLIRENETSIQDKRLVRGSTGN